MPRALWWYKRGGRFLTGEVPLHRDTGITKTYGPPHRRSLQWAYRGSSPKQVASVGYHTCKCRGTGFPHLPENRPPARTLPQAYA